MFDIHKIRPVHGWRELFGEIGIIVVGVLIALAAEQLVEWFHWRHRSEQARDALTETINIDRIHLAERVVIEPCLSAQLDRLEAGLLAATDKLQPVVADMTYMGRTAYRAPDRDWNSDVWNGVVAEQISSHLPQDLRLGYGIYFSANSELRALNRDEVTAAAQLTSLSLPLSIDAGVRAHFVEIIEMERQRSHLMMLFAKSQLQSAQTLAPDKPQTDLRTERAFTFGANSTTGYCRAHHLPLAPMPKLS